MMKRKGSLTDSDGVQRPVGPDPSARVGLAVLCVASVIVGVLIVKQGSLQVARSRVQTPSELVPATQTQVLATSPVRSEEPASPAQTQDDGRSTREAAIAPDPDGDLWNSVRGSDDPAVLEHYLTRYPGGRFADTARQRIAELHIRQQPAPDPVKPPSDEVSKTETPKTETPKTEGPKVAVIPPPPEASEVAPPSRPDTGELARSLQRELKRVGCLDGESDGRWGEQSKSALRNFVRYSKLAIDGDEPSLAVLDAATAAQSRVCPLVCDVDEHLVNGRCVEKPRPAHERAHEAERSRDRSRERAERQRAERPKIERASGEPSNSGQRLCFGAGRTALVACR